MRWRRVVCWLTGHYPDREIPCHRCGHPPATRRSSRVAIALPPAPPVRPKPTMTETTTEAYARELAHRDPRAFFGIDAELGLIAKRIADEQRRRRANG